MSNSMTMMFEVADLRQASPATVSRCGMVYLQPDQLGWWPIFQSFLFELQETMEGLFSQRIEELFDGLVEKSIVFIK
jgi:dynein heavy chain